MPFDLGDDAARLCPAAGLMLATGTRPSLTSRSLMPPGEAAVGAARDEAARPKPGETNCANSSFSERRITARRLSASAIGSTLSWARRLMRPTACRVCASQRNSHARGSMRAPRPGPRAPRVSLPPAAQRAESPSLHRAPGGARLSRALHPSRRHLQLAAPHARPGGRDLQTEGLPDQRLRPAQDHDARRRRIHPPLSPARAAERLPPHRHYGLFAGAARAHNIENARHLLAAPEASPERAEADSEAEAASPARQ